MIISISVPATGFFTCKAFLFLFLSNKWISSQAVIPAWLGLSWAWLEWEGEHSCLPTPGHSARAMHIQELEAHTCGSDAVYLWAVYNGGKSECCGQTLSLHVHVHMLGSCSGLSVLYCTCHWHLWTLHLCRPDDFAFGQIQLETVQPRKEHWVLLPEALWLFSHSWWQGLGGIRELWWTMGRCWGFKKMKEGRRFGEGWWKCPKFSLRQ